MTYQGFLTGVDLDPLRVFSHARTERNGEGLHLLIHDHGLIRDLSRRGEEEGNAPQRLLFTAAAISEEARLLKSEHDLHIAQINDSISCYSSSH